MKPKVLLIQLIIPQYRVPVFNRLGLLYDLTVTYVNKDDSPEDVSYKRQVISERHLGPFFFHNIRSLCDSFDVVIYMPNIHCLNFCLVPFLPHKYKTISYSIGLRASYNTKFDLSRKKNFFDKLFGIIQFKGDAVITYFKETLSFWDLNPSIEKKCFETRNTTEVLGGDVDESSKNSILFVGSLYKEKKVEELIRAYKNVYEKYNYDNFPKLEIIGGGELLDDLKKQIVQIGLANNVFIRGAIYDENVLKSYFLKSYACISPNQAGLSIPKSMGYGVPFVTLWNAITGGEILHIENGKNGILMDSFEDLEGIIEDIYLNSSKYLEMGRNAKIYYNKSANIDVMVKGFSDAINYVLNK